MIDKILNKFGYVKKDSEKDIYLKFAEEIGDLRQYEVNPKYEKMLFEQIATLDGAEDYFKATIAQDMQRHFAAQEDISRSMIRGAMSRTAYYVSLLRPKKAEPKTKIDNLRYGK